MSFESMSDFDCWIAINMHEMVCLVWRFNWKMQITDENLKFLRKNKLNFDFPGAENIRRAACQSNIIEVCRGTRISCFDSAFPIDQFGLEKVSRGKS